MQCVDSGWTSSMSKERGGTVFAGQHGRCPKRGHERMIQVLGGKNKNCQNPTTCADVGLIDQRLSLHKRQFSSVTPSPRQAAEQVSLVNDSKEKCWTTCSTQWQWHRKVYQGVPRCTKNTTFTWTSVAPGYVIYPPFCQENKKPSMLPYFPFTAPSSHVFVLLRLQTWLRNLMRDGKTLPWVERFK